MSLYTSSCIYITKKGAFFYCYVERRRRERVKRSIYIRYLILSC